MKEKIEARRNKNQKNKKAFLLMTILCMGIGFAFLSSSLTITGNTNVSASKWNIYFTNVQVTNGSVDATVVPTTSGTNTTSLDYTILLDKPGDFYEFRVDAVNNGTINGKIKNILMTDLNEDVAKYLSYTATYLDGTPLGQDDILAKNSTTTYKIRVEFKSEITASDLSEDNINLNLTFGIEYVQAQKMVQSRFVKLVKDDALSDSGIDFAVKSSENNGNGLYVRSGTEEDTYPIYYYRGAVTNNNAKFAGFCWKIVRTTETGGTKLIYNGTPNKYGQCVSTAGVSTNLLYTSSFNSPSNAIGYSGYMYGTADISNFKNVSDSNNYIYGSDFEYVDGNYKLINTTTGVDNISTHHYTCYSESDTCSELNYIYYLQEWSSTSLRSRYVILTNGRTVKDIIEGGHTNTNDSVLKVNLEDWFSRTFNEYFINSNTDYNDYLEDTVWCNDRSFNTIDVDEVPTYVNSGWNPDGGDVSKYLYYSVVGRLKAGTPSLSCSNKNDSFTVEETTKGNGLLTYPIGLLTMDEVMLAGGTAYQYGANNNNFYLNNNGSWWTMSPSNFSNEAIYLYFVNSSGYGNTNTANTSSGVRPSISLKPGVKVVTGGNGTAENPYEFLVG